MDKKKFVEQDLASFLQLHSVQIESEPDDVVLSYIMEAIDLVINGGGDAMDVDEFVEIMTAYIPELITVEREKVTMWLFEVVVRLRENEAAVNKAAQDMAKASDDKKSITPVLPSDSDVCMQCKCNFQKAEIAPEMDEGVEALLCMFPTLTVEDAEDFLGLAGGNLQAAADLVLESPHPNKIGGKLRERSSSEGDEERRKYADKTGSTQHRWASESRSDSHDRCSTCCCHCHTPCQSSTARAQVPSIAGDLKQKIIERYSLVPDAGDNEIKEHRPFLPTEQPKKMTRYLDGRIVSTKGETRIDIKQPESADMKKTYINLKPARKYKFH